MVQLNVIRDLARKELTELLDQFSGSKVLVWDDALTGPVDLIVNAQFLRERSVLKMFPLQPGKIPHSGTNNIVFITRPEVKLMDMIATNVQAEDSGRGHGQERPEFHILFVPNRSLLCERRLKDRGVFGSFTILDEFSLFWFPLDNDVISMENGSIFREFHLEQDPTCLLGVAKGIMELQAMFGFFPKVYGKGRAAKQLFDFMSRLRKESLDTENQVAPQFDNLILIDRRIDVISPLVKQLTYEGLIDEMFGIKNAMVRLPADKFTTPEGSASEQMARPGRDQKTIQLNSNDDMFADLRDKNFNAVGPYLQRSAKAIMAECDERHEAKTVQELKQFVDKIPKIQTAKQALAVHTTITEMIKAKCDTRQFREAIGVEQELLNFQGTDRPVDYIEDAACQNEDLMHVLRLMCLQSVVNSGLKPKLLEFYRRLLLQTYGNKHLLSLINLEKLGLLAPQTTTRNYAVLRKRLNLTLDDVNELSPNDIAYVHTVYAPLSVRLVQNFAHPGWRAIRDVLEALPGPTLEETQPIPSNLKTEKIASGINSKKSLVLFIGGCTFAEISALRFLSQQEESMSEFVIATTSVINGDSFLGSLMTNVTDAMI